MRVRAVAWSCRADSRKALAVMLALAASMGFAAGGSPTASAGEKFWGGNTVDRLMAARLRNALTGHATPVESIGDLDRPDFRPQVGMRTVSPRRLAPIPAVQLASLSHDLPMSLPLLGGGPLIEPLELPRYPEHGQAKVPGMAAVVASLGKDFAIPEVSKQPSLSGADKIRWVASADCLVAPLRAVLAEVAERFGPLRVNSTCRSKKHNARVGGAKRSYHLTGEAVDFRVFGSISQIHAFLSGKRGVVGGLKHYGFGVFHIDTGPRRTWATPRRFKRKA